MLNPNIFAAADILWGRHTIDRFSSFKTRQLLRFCSRWLNPCMEVLDAFSVRWSGENNRKYFRVFQKWETWAKQKKVSVIPAQPIFFNLFLLFQIKKESSFSTFRSITSAVAWDHKKLGLYSPTESAMTKQLIRAGRRILSCATAKGKHISYGGALKSSLRQICLC